MTEAPLRDRAVILSAADSRALLAGELTQIRVPLTPRTASFGSAPPVFWKHANFDQAWVDGRPESGQYLHVPCHRGDEEELARLDVHWAEMGRISGACVSHTYRTSYPDSGSCAECDHRGWRMTSHRLWPRFKVDGRLWVKEPHAWADKLVDGYERDDPTNIAYRADGSLLRWGEASESPVVIHGFEPDGLDEQELAQLRWRSGALMPMWAARTWLRIKSVGVERDEARWCAVVGFEREA